tara:strand:- start:8581 stop:8883 length:303 start_codon:yes stop_codon:yes gene_type:complete
MKKLIDTVKPSEAVSSLEELKGTLAWELIEESLMYDANKAVLDIGSDPIMTEREIHFRRGSIHASRNFKNIPDVLLRYFLNQQALQKSNSAGDALTGITK